MAPSPRRDIATENEGPLHAALKRVLAEPGDRFEVPVDGRQIDLVRGALLVEIQTGSLSPLHAKLTALLVDHEVRVVHPVPIEKWIVRLDADGGVLGRRKSPRRGRLEDAFASLVGLRALLGHPRFSLELVLTREEEVRQQGPIRRWRRGGWMIVERRLVDVVERRLFARARDLLTLLPSSLEAPFTTADVAQALAVPREVAQQMTYCLREAGVLTARGKVGRSVAYHLAG